jgi:proteasome lid subunit RPN8/RPN11
VSNANVTNSVLELTGEQFRQIEAEGVGAYPNECCGILFGRDVNDGGVIRRVVERLLPVTNAFDAGEQYHRFSISPRQLMEAEKDAGANGQLVLGYYHSHPDHPARPSETDRQAAWPFYSYVIVSILKRHPADMTSWVLDEQTETFSRQNIVEVDETDPTAEVESSPLTTPLGPATPADTANVDTRTIEPLERRNPL